MRDQDNRQSLIVGYDAPRGEQRAKWRKNEERTAGDCIDCGLCVSTCPTGIDIRAGAVRETDASHNGSVTVICAIGRGEYTFQFRHARPPIR